MREWQLTIETLDGEKDVLNFNTYNEAMSKYRELKESNLDNIHMIQFDKNENGIISNKFTKKVNKRKAYKTCREIANDVNNSFNLLEELKLHHECILKISERKRENLLHLIRAVDNKAYNDENEVRLIKLNLFDELALWENKRKNSKNELEDIYNLQKSSSNLNIDSLLKPRGKVKLHTENIDVTRNKYERFITYENEKDKERYLKQNSNYAYYIIDDYTQSIYFYNKFDGQKSKKEFKKALNNNNVVKLAVNDIANYGENVYENKKSNTEVKILEYKTIKQKGHFMSNYKNKFKYMQDCPNKKKLYFSNNPIDVDLFA